MGILMSAYVADTDAQAQAEAKEGVWYFLKNCLKGHLRREGRQLTFGPGIPYIPPEEFQRFLQISDPTTPLLGDAESWDDLQQSASIIVGSAETVYRRIMDILTHSKVGNLLIQFHLGNMQDALTRKSMRLFARDVFPAEEDSRLFAREFPTPRTRRWRSEFAGARLSPVERAKHVSEPEDGVLRKCSGDPSPIPCGTSTCPLPQGERRNARRSSIRTVDRRKAMPRGKASRSSICMALPTCTASPADLQPFHQRLAQHAPRDRAGASGLHRLRRARGLLHRRRGLSLSRSARRELLPRFDLVGHCAGGWIAAELAVRHPERVARLALIGACGLFVPGEPIGDVFMHAQPERGIDCSDAADAAVRRSGRRGSRCAGFPTAAATSTRRCAATRCCASARSWASSRPTSIIASCASGSIARRCRRW